MDGSIVPIKPEGEKTQTQTPSGEISSPQGISQNLPVSQGTSTSTLPIPAQQIPQIQTPLPPPQPVQPSPQKKQMSKKMFIAIFIMLIIAFIIYFLLYSYIKEIYDVAVGTQFGARI